MTASIFCFYLLFFAGRVDSLRPRLGDISSIRCWLRCKVVDGTAQKLEV